MAVYLSASIESLRHQGFEIPGQTIAITSACSSFFILVVAGFALLGIDLPLSHYTFMGDSIHVESRYVPEGFPHGSPFPADPAALFIGVLRALFAGVVIAILTSVGNVLSGLFIRARKNRMFSL